MFNNFIVDNHKERLVRYGNSSMFCLVDEKTQRAHNREATGSSRKDVQDFESRPTWMLWFERFMKIDFYNSARACAD